MATRSSSGAQPPGAVRPDNARFEQRIARLEQRIAELERLATHAEDARRAALNLMEDAVLARDALRESEQRFRTIADSAPALIWMNDLDGCEFVNRQYLEFLGADLADVRGYDWAHYIHEDDREAYVNAYRQALGQQNVFEAECRFRRHDGQYRWTHAVGQPRRNLDGELIGYAGISIDITDRKTAELALGESEKRLRLATEGAQMGIWDWNLETNQAIWDERSSQLLGLEPRPMVAPVSTFFECVHPDDLARLTEALNKAVDDGKRFDDEFRVMHADGEVSWMAARGEVFRNSSGKPVRMSGVNFDITHRKQLEHQLQELNESLEEQIAQRTEMLKLLQEVTRSANEALTVEQAMYAAVARIADYNGWQVGHVWRLADDGSGDMVSSGIWHVTDQAEWAIGRLAEFRDICTAIRFAPGDILVGAVASSSQARWIDDLRESTDWRRCDAKEFGLHAVIAFPVTVKGKAVAVLEFFSDHAASREDRFMEIMPDVGIQLGHVIERKRLEKEVADAAEHEQRRIGSDIHDGVGQELTGLRYMAKTHAEALVLQSSSEAKTAQRMTRWLEIVQHQLRAIVRKLVPVEINEHGLVAALTGLARQIEHAHDLVCSVECQQAISVPDTSLATHIYRIAQESVNNAVQHAGASEIRIMLTENAGVITLQVDDDGIGIGSNAKHATGFGIRSMRYRAGLIGARVEILTREERGTRVSCTVLRGGGGYNISGSERV